MAIRALGVVHAQRRPVIGRLRRGPAVAFLAVAAAASAAAQVPDDLLPLPTPTPVPGRLLQDDFDFLGRSSVVLGSGARALGMGGAFLARADDATAASWNPAGLSYLRTLELSVVGARNSFETIQHDSGGVRQLRDESLGYTPDFLAVALPFEIGEVSGAAQLSFQRTFSQFAVSRDIERGANPPLHYDGSQGFDVLSLGTGVQVSRTLRFGATLNRWVDGYRHQRERLQRRRSLQSVDFALSGWNLNLGAMWTPTPSLNVGVVAKTPFTAAVALYRGRLDIESEPPSVTSNSYYSEAVRLDFPGAIGLGVSVRPESRLTLSADYTRTFWSNGRIRDFFVLAPEGEPAPPDEVFDTLPWPSLAGEQVDTQQLRFGAEFVVLGSGFKVPLRAGYFTDRQFFEVDGAAPSFDGFTAGTGLSVGPVLLDVALVFESGRFLDEQGATTHVNVHRLFVSLIYRRDTH